MVVCLGLEWFNIGKFYMEGSEGEVKRALGVFDDLESFVDFFFFENYINFEWEDILGIIWYILYILQIR